MSVFRTERLTARKMTWEDHDFLLELFSDREVMAFYPSLKSKQETAEWIQWNLSHYRRFNTGLYILEDKAGSSIGQCGIVPQKVEEQVELEIGYLIARPFWGKGYGTEAVRGCVQYGINRAGYQRLIAQIDPLNKASIRVAEKSGFRFEKEISRWKKNTWLYSLSPLYLDGK